MKIVSRKEFLLMPNGTVYATYTAESIASMQYVGTLQIKVETWHNDDKEPFDWIYFEPHDLPNFKDGEFSGSRDGMYDEKQLFLIYEKADIELIAKTLLTANEVYAIENTR